MEEYRAAYEAAIHEYYDDEVMPDVRFVAREICVGHGRNPDDIVTDLPSSDHLLRAGLNQFALERRYVPAWYNYAGFAQSAIDAMRVLDATRV